MHDLELLMDLYQGTPRQGPGGDAETKLAMTLAGLDGSRPLEIADIGCGTGASTLLLAGLPRTRITAVDFLPGFLAELEARAVTLKLSDRMRTLACSMDELPFEDESLDVLWSEGAIYNIGFESGVRRWRRLLKPGAVLAVSEITWTTATRPAELSEYWEANYPEIDTAAAKFRVLEDSGYSPRGYFVLPARCWLVNFYQPLLLSCESFLVRHDHSAAAWALVDETRAEAALYERYQDHFSYGFYLATRVDLPGP